MAEQEEERNERDNNNEKKKPTENSSPGTVHTISPSDEKTVSQ